MNRKSHNLTLGLIAALGAFGMHSIEAPSHYTTGFRPDPEPDSDEPTKHDLDRIAKAQARRERRNSNRK